MQNTTADYKLEINKPSRSFECKITIGDNIYNNEDIVNMTFDYLQANEGFSIGNTVSQTLDLTLLNKGDIIYSTSQIKVEIGLKVGSTFEYILMGIFNIDDIEKTDYTTKFTAYDNMIKFETAYFSELGDNPTLQQVVNELEKKTGVQFIGNLPAYTVSKLEGFSCREVLSYVASICGGNALITRQGKFTIKTLTNVEKSIDGNNYFDYTREEVKYKIGQVTCQVNEGNTISKGAIGTDSMELQFENPWITESILNDIYNKLKSVEYLGYSMKWQGDISLDPFDIITVTDVKNVTRSIPILSQKFSYTGGLTCEIGAKGETKNKNSFSSNGSNSNKLNRVVMEQAIIKEALIEKANIKDLEVSNAKIENLQAKTATIENAIIGVAYIKDLTVINANIDKLIANDATINNALINKADITELNAVSAKINVLEADSANIKDLLAGNLTGENIQAGGITSDKLTIANGFITNAMIANLDVSKLNAADISTTKFRIVSDSGKMLIADNTIQISDNNRVRVQIGKDASNDYNMYVWDNEGKLMFDATGLKADGIKNKIIRDDMISDNANIDGSKLNISSLITEVNKDTNTSVIKSSKVQLDTLGQTLEVAFNSLKTNVEGIQIGSRNYIINGKVVKFDPNNIGLGTSVLMTDEKEKYYRATPDNGYNVSLFGYPSKSESVEVNQEYIYSLMVRCNADTTINLYDNHHGNSNKQTHIVANKWTKIECYPQILNRFDGALILVSSTQNAYLDYKLFKLEKGNKSTDFTEAPEDIDSAINEIKEATESNSTTINIMQGQISTAINNTTIEKDGQSILLKDDYNRTVATVNSINSTLGSHKTLIDSNTGNITSVDTKINAVQRDLEGTKSIVSSNSSRIDGLNSTVSNQGSSISQLQNQISLKVETTEVNTIINGAIDNIEVGGRNLMPQSNREWGSSTEYIGVRITDIVSNYVGKKMTISCDIKANKNGEIHFYSLGGYGVGFNIQYQVTTDWTRLKATGVFTFHEPNQPWCDLSVYGIYGTGLISLIRNIKIEVGDKATDYTKAPEDIDLSISTVDGKVNVVQSEVTTTKNQVASIETNLNGIIQRVSNTETTTETLTANLNITTSTANNAQSIANNSIVEITTTKKQIADIVTNIDSITQRVSSTESTTVNLQGQISQNGNNIANLNTEIVNTKNQVASIETNLSGITQRVQHTETVSAKVEDINYLTKVAGIELLPQLFRSGNNNGYFVNGEGSLSNYLNVDLGYTLHLQGHTWVATDFIKIDRSNPIYFYTKYYNHNGLLYIGIERYRQDKTVIHNFDNGACEYLLINSNDTGSYIDYEQFFTEWSQETAYIKLRILSNWDNREGLSQSLFARLTLKQLQGNIQDNIIYHEQRIQTAEQKITPTAIINTVSETINNGTGSINTVSTVLDRNGLTVNNGAIRIRNNAGTNVLEADVNGNLILTGTIKSQSGEQYVSLNSGGITFQDAHRNEQILRMATSAYASNRDINGMTIAMAQYCDYVRFSHLQKADLNGGWDSSVSQYNFFDLWSGDQTIGSTKFKKGINIFAPTYFRGGSNILIDQGSNYWGEIGNAAWNSISGQIGVFGDNGVLLGFKSNDTKSIRLALTESAHPGTGDQIRSYGNWNCSGYTVHSATFSGNHVNSYANTLTRSYSQTHCIEASSKQVRINFEDMQIKDGKLILNIPNMYKGIHCGYIISSIVNKGEANVWVDEELEERFIIRSTADIKVNVELIIKLEGTESYARISNQDEPPIVA